MELSNVASIAATVVVMQLTEVRPATCTGLPAWAVAGPPGRHRASLGPDPSVPQWVARTAPWATPARQAAAVGHDRETALLIRWSDRRWV
jgi:hypothetical protein